MLQSLGRVTREAVFELKVGPVRVEIGEGRATFFRDGAPEVRAPRVGPDELAAMIGVPGLAGPALRA